MFTSRLRFDGINLQPAFKTLQHSLIDFSIRASRTRGKHLRHAGILFLCQRHDHHSGALNSPMASKRSWSITLRAKLSLARMVYCDRK